MVILLKEQGVLISGGAIFSQSVSCVLCFLGSDLQVLKEASDGMQLAVLFSCVESLPSQRVLGGVSCSFEQRCKTSI